jgi:hypothetical protein
MKRIERLVVACALLCFFASAKAVLPESGLWYNPAESGRGYGIEVQDDRMFVTYYAYDDGGATSAFYTSLGRIDLASGSVIADFYAFGNGQCFGCAYRSPVPTSLGQAVFRFTSMKTGTITLPGNLVIPIRRQLFAGFAPNAALLGTWHLTTGAFGLYFGDALWLQQPIGELEGGFAGRVIDGSSQRILVGQPLDDGLVAILVDSSTSFYTAYAFEWAGNRWVGRSWTYRKTETLSGDGLPFFASRLLGKNLSEQSSSVEVPKNAASEAEALLELRAEASASGAASEVTSFKIERREVSRAEVADAISGLRDRMAEAKRMLGAYDPS